MGNVNERHAIASPFACIEFPLVPPQVPGQITWNESQYVHMMPLEVVGWLLRSVEAESGCWVMVLSRDVMLASQLSTRSPVPLNVVLGLSHLDVSDIDRVKELVPTVISKVKQCCRLHWVRWEGHPAQREL